MGELSNITSEGSKKLKEEYEKVSELENKPLQLNETWYLVDKRWYDQWKRYAMKNECESENPGPINNSGLYLDNTIEEVKEHMMEGIDYLVLPKNAWDILVKRYGVVDNQSPIERKVIEDGKFTKTLSVEIYPIRLKLCNYTDKETFVRKFSRAATIDELDKEMRKCFKIPSNTETKLWDASLENDYQELDKTHTVQKSSLQKDQLIIVETKKPDGEWQVNGKKPSNFSHLNGNSSVSSSYTGGGTMFSASNSSTSSSYQLRNTSYTDSYSKKLHTTGLCGLNNLGNTCFMNSALQCLSNVPTLTNYFKENEFRKDLNVNNPLGMQGKIASTYADLIQKIWSGENSSLPPREFKYAVGQFQPRFVGYQQQDSQELLAFLVDGLHEDLNRISKKPYIEIKDAGDRPLRIVAQEAWDNHRKRNDSVIVDTFHGLFRSVVDCPECPRVSVTFDPFCYLTLPLPVKKEKPMECTFIPLDNNRSMVKYKVTVPKSGIVKDICKAVSAFNNLPHENMVVTDVYNSRFHKVFQQSDQIRSIYDKDVIYIFETFSDATVVPVYMRYVSERGGCVLFGQPLIVSIPNSENGTVSFVRLYRKILTSASRFLKDEELKEKVRKLLKMDEEDILERMRECGDSSVDTKENDCYDVFNMFQIKSVNSFGTQEYKHYNYDDKTIKLSETHHLSADWSKAFHEANFTKQYDELVEKHGSLSPSNLKKAATVNLMSCMDLFTSKEQLGEDNAWYCSDCKKHQQAYKKFDLWMLPPVLIIHLKRFSNSRWSRDKLDTFVDFPVRDLDLSEFVVNPIKNTLPEDRRKYNLIAVSNHYGGLGGGHYTAFAKNHIDKQWHYFDDSSVSSSSEDRVVTKAAYLLIYQRQDLEQWQEKHPGQAFRFFEPIFSPRAIEMDAESNGSSFQYQQSKEDILNNNTEVEMDTS